MRLIAHRVRAEHSWRIGERLDRAFGCVLFTAADLDEVVAREVAGVTGSSVWATGRLVHLADRLSTTLPVTMSALQNGRVDLARVQVLVEAVSGLETAAARRVEKVMLAQLPGAADTAEGDPVGPWDGPSPRAWAQRVNRAVARESADTAERVQRNLRERTGTWVQIHDDNPAVATLTVTGPTELVLGIESVLDLAVRGMDRAELAGRTLGMAKVDLLAEAVTDQAGEGHRSGETGADEDDEADAVPTRAAVVRRVVRRELGVVLHADTLFDDGPAADDPGEVRGTCTPVPATAVVARVLAGQLKAAGASTCVLLADEYGMLVRLLRIGAAPESGWTRTTFTAAVRRAAARGPQPQHETRAYEPTVQIAETVRARDPVCTFPGCGVSANRCDLDHGVPHPRGPTSVMNLSPRSRRCHRYKTAGLWRVRTLNDAAALVTAHEWTSPLGTRQVVEVPPLPGYARGEAYATR